MHPHESPKCFRNNIRIVLSKLKNHALEGMSKVGTAGRRGWYSTRVCVGECKGTGGTVRWYGWYCTRVRLLRYKDTGGKSTGGTKPAPLVPTNPHPEKKNTSKLNTKQPIFQNWLFLCFFGVYGLVGTVEYRFGTTRALVSYHQSYYPYPCTVRLVPQYHTHCTPVPCPSYPCTVPRTKP